MKIISWKVFSAFPYSKLMQDECLLCKFPASFQIYQLFFSLSLSIQFDCKYEFSLSTVDANGLFSPSKQNSNSYLVLPLLRSEMYVLMWIKELCEFFVFSNCWKIHCIFKISLSFSCWKLQNLFLSTFSIPFLPSLSLSSTHTNIFWSAPRVFIQCT